MRVAAAQTIPKPDTTANIHDHLRLALQAAGAGARLIIFPEMSLTGYQREMGSELAFEPADPRLQPLQELALARDLIIVAGAPIRIGSQLYIGAFVLGNGPEPRIYIKQFLHGDEKLWYVPGFDHNPLVEIENEQVSLAICADISNAQHPANAKERGTTLYAAGIFYTPQSVDKAHNSLADYAGKHQMKVLMANYGGSSWQLEAGGGSACWDQTGKMIAGIEGNGEGLLITEL